jgi:DNA repair exonuclease SbcCD ATPase subunit
LFEGISWALYGQTSKGEKGMAIVRRNLGRGGSAKGRVVLQSPTRGTLTIERTQSKSAHTLVATLSGIDCVDHVESGDVRVVQAYVDKILGVSFEFFTQLVYFSQESVEFFSGMGDADKKKLLGVLLGLSWYDAAADIAKKERDRLNEQLPAITNKLVALAAQEESLNSQIQDAVNRARNWQVGQESLIALAHSNVVKFEKEIGLQDAVLKSKLAEKNEVLALGLKSLLEHNERALEQLLCENELQLQNAERTATKRLLENQVLVEDTWSKLACCGDAPEVQALLDANAREMKETQNQLKVSREARSEASSKLAVVKAEQARLKKELTKIRSVSGGKCPVCYQEVTEESKDRCAGEFEEQLGVQHANMLIYEADVEEVRKQVASLEDAEVSLRVKSEEYSSVLRSRTRLEESLSQLLTNMSVFESDHEKQIVSLKASQALSVERRHKQSADMKAEFDAKVERELAFVQVSHKADCATIQQRLENARNEIEQLKAQTSPMDGVKASLEEKLHACGVSIVDLRSEESVLRDGIACAVFWLKGFGREGIPATLLRGFCSAFTAEVNDVLMQLGVGVSVDLSASTELKSGEVRDRLSYEIKTPTGDSSYKLLSGGEKVRVNLTSMLALNQLSSRQFNIKNGLFGVLVLDEVLSALDEEGCELTHELLGKFLARSIYVISHDQAFRSLFDSVVLVRRTDDISVVV